LEIEKLAATYTYLVCILLVGLPLSIRAIYVDHKEHPSRPLVLQNLLWFHLLTTLWPVTVFWFYQETIACREHKKFKRGDLIFYTYNYKNKIK